MARRLPLLLCLTLLPLAGCVADIADDSWRPRRALGKDYATFRPPVNPAGVESANSSATTQPAGMNEPTGEITLRDALAFAMLGSPELSSVAWDVRIAEAEQLQAGAGPNPELEVEVEEFGGTGEKAGTDSAGARVALSQLIELGHKRRKRIALAAAERKLAGWDYETARMAVLTEVATRFIDVLVLQEKVALARENIALAQQTRAAVARRVDAGKIRPSESTRADVSVAMSDIQSKRTTRLLLAARAALAATWGSATPRFESVAGQLRDTHPVPPMKRLAELLDQGPDLARWDQELVQLRAAADLAKAGSVPDLTVGAGYKYFGASNDQAFVVSLGIPLPLFDRNQGRINKARFALAKAKFDRDAATVKAHTALAHAYQKLATAHGETVALREVVLPGAKTSFDTSLTLFEQGKTTYLSVLDARKTLAEVRGQYLDSLTAYHRSVAEIEGMIGQRLPWVTGGAHDDAKLDDRK